MLIGAVQERPQPTIDVAAGLRFELFYALHAVLNDGRPWQPSETLLAIHRDLGAWPEIWLGIGDLLGDVPTDASFGLIVERLDEVPARDVVRTLLIGMLHDDAIVDAVADGRLTPKAAIKKLPASKSQWLAHVGLFPYDADKPSGRFVTRLLDDPEGVRDSIINAVQAFWDEGFADFWRDQEGAYRAAARAMDQDLRSDDLATVIAINRLPVEIDETTNELCALRGGYRADIDSIVEVRLMPSAFNTGRFWTMLEGKGGKVAHFPAHQPSLLASLDEGPSPRDVDLALVCRALGNSSRVAIADLLAERPRSATEVAETLGLSKSTVSHHLFLMREAGLINEELTPSRSIILRLERGAFFALPDAAMRRFFSRDGT